MKRPNTLARAVEDIRVEATSQEPDFTVSVPPSDNRRLTRAKRLTPEARDYKKEYSQLRILMPDPPVVVIFQMYWVNEKRDPSNCIKILQDALFANDNEVACWPMPTVIVDKKNPRLDLWIVKV